jgi:hypothetical protein
MDFSGPEPADFRNVRSLNYEFLSCLRSPSAGIDLRRQMAAELGTIISSLTDRHVERLSATPFLLFSLRERDPDYWSFLSTDEPNRDLLSTVRSTDELGQLAAAGLGFLWQLAQRNPYAARLVSGATLSWCEQLADRTLFRVMQRMAGRPDLLRPRRVADAGFWLKLLGPGLSSDQDVRTAAQLSALQSILTEDSATRYRALPAAACSSAAPMLLVADKLDRP